MEIIKLPTIFILLIIFQIKHYYADYVFQNEYMLGKFKKFPDFILPLTAHAGVHAFFTFCIVTAFQGLINMEAIHSMELVDIKLSLGLSLLDFVVHWIVDRIKASPNLGGKFKYLMPIKTDDGIKFVRAEDTHIKFREELQNYYIVRVHNSSAMGKAKESNKKFWKALGLDQTAHHLTHYYIIYLLMQITTINTWSFYV